MAIKKLDNDSVNLSIATLAFVTTEHGPALNLTTKEGTVQVDGEDFSRTASLFASYSRKGKHRNNGGEAVEAAAEGGKKRGRKPAKEGKVKVPRKKRVAAGEPAGPAAPEAGKPAAGEPAGPAAPEAGKPAAAEAGKPAAAEAGKPAAAEAGKKNGEKK